MHLSVSVLSYLTIYLSIGLSNQCVLSYFVLPYLIYLTQLYQSSIPSIRIHPPTHPPLRPSVRPSVRPSMYVYAHEDVCTPSGSQTTIPDLFHEQFIQESFIAPGKAVARLADSKMGGVTQLAWLGIGKQCGLGQGPSTECETWRCLDP